MSDNFAVWSRFLSFYRGIIEKIARYLDSWQPNRRWSLNPLHSRSKLLPTCEIAYRTQESPLSNGIQILIFFSPNFLGEPESLVFGSLLDGVFDGQIISPSMGTYYVEKASKYFPPEALRSNDTNQGFHSIVYKESDVDDLHEDGDPG